MQTAIPNFLAQESSELWISSGQQIARPMVGKITANPYTTLIAHQNVVQVQIDKGLVTVRWVMAGANWFSLLIVNHVLESFPGPFNLEFFNGGWFNERYDGVKNTVTRLDYLMTSADMRLSSRVFTQSFNPKSAKMPELLRSAFESGLSPSEETVTCSINPHNGLVQVEKIGANSALAKLWGQAPISFPCKNGNSYDVIISKPYYDVLESGRPHYDHVCASMVHPNGKLEWMSYQRIVFPGGENEIGHPLVNVLCERAPIGILLW